MHITLFYLELKVDPPNVDGDFVFFATNELEHFLSEIIKVFFRFLKRTPLTLTRNFPKYDKHRKVHVYSAAGTFSPKKYSNNHDKYENI